MFRSSHFWFLVTFGNEVMKIQKYYVSLVYILQGNMSKMEKKERKSHNLSDQNTKNQKARNYGMNKTQVFISSFVLSSN